MSERHFLGVDLAWGERSPTGVAVLDAAGRLLHVSTHRTDDDIDAALRPFLDGPTVMGIDAPIVVVNPTGSRPAERALTKDFRRFEAGTHPANTGRPEFAGGTRAQRLCDRWGLAVHPPSDGARRAMEVYPHAATVVLFDLARTLKYKDKRGRDLELLRSEMLTLMDHVATVVTTDEVWAGLRRDVVAATRKSQLRTVEDQVDAVICAHVALLAHTRPESLTVYGDADTGAIVTPSLPSATDEATPDPARDAIRRFTAERPALEAACEAWIALVAEVLDEAGINYLSVTGRVKSVESFAEKVARRRDGELLFPDPESQIIDRLGLRVITYVRSDVHAVADLLGQEVTITDDRDMGERTAAQGRFGYASRHLLMTLDESWRTDPRWTAVGGSTAQVQVRTVLQHAWAEFEHEARYKGDIPAQHARDLDRRFTLAAGLLELADEQFSVIRDTLRTTGSGDDPAGSAAADVSENVDGDAGTDGGDDAEDADDPRLDTGELAAFLAGQYADAGWSRADRYRWISGLLLELGITRLDELATVIRAPEVVGLNDRLGYRFPPGAVRRLDDALLATYGSRYVELTGNAHRIDLLRNRLRDMT